MACLERIIFLTTLFFGTVISISSPVNNPEWKLLSERTLDNIPPKWDLLEEPVLPETVLSFRVLLKQRNLDQFERVFWQVSDPESPSWRRFLTLEQINDIVSPSNSVFRAVRQWLSSVGIQEVKMKSTGDAVIVQEASVIQLKALFPLSDFRLFVNRQSGKRLVRHFGSLYVPHHIAQHIDFIVGLSELIDTSTLKYKAFHSREVGSAPSNDIVTPQVLREFYDIEETSSSGEGSQSIAAFNDYYSEGAFETFQSYFNVTPKTSITNVGASSCLQEGCDQFESDLDTQYITAMGEGISTYFWEMSGTNWILEWAMDVASSSNPPLVHSISYGTNEVLQCILADCSTYGYSNQQYSIRSDTELQKLGMLGLTVFVASGDDGASGARHSLGYCPVDSVNHYCPLGGCTYTSSACGGLLVTLPSSSNFYGTMVSSCVIPTGGLCQSLINDTVNAAAQANPNCDIKLDYDQEHHPHLYTTCNCSSITSTTIVIKGATYEVAGYVYQTGSMLFDAQYPASSPYVVAVGGTQFTGSSSDFGEIACSILNGSLINSGGGFSYYEAMPSYQMNAVESYLKSGVILPPKGTYNTSNRAYPDMAFNGNSVVISVSNNTADFSECPCVGEFMYGTSASSPSTAGMFSLINAILLEEGQPSLGFLNPLLYQMATKAPTAFHDITEGYNNCAGNSGSCCLYGYYATEGWDPVTGWGTPNFPVILEYFKENPPPSLTSTSQSTSQSTSIYLNTPGFSFLNGFIAFLAIDAVIEAIF